jgi:hypothetical protein
VPHRVRAGGAFIFRRLLGASELTEPAVLALRAGVFPLLVAVRSALSAGRPAALAPSHRQFLRLFLAIMVFTVVPRVPGAVGGRGARPPPPCWLRRSRHRAEMRTPEKEDSASPAHEAGRRLSGKVRFLAPLAWTMVLGSLTNPLVNAFIARTPDPKQGLAVFSVVASLIWFMASSVLRFSSVTIALGTTRANLRRLERFVWRYVGGVCVAVFLVTLTPAAGILLERIIGLSFELVARAACLALLSCSLCGSSVSAGILTQRPHRVGRVRRMSCAWRSPGSGGRDRDGNARRASGRHPPRRGLRSRASHLVRPARPAERSGPGARAKRGFAAVPFGPQRRKEDDPCAHS